MLGFSAKGANNGLRVKPPTTELRASKCASKDVMHKCDSHHKCKYPDRKSALLREDVIGHLIFCLIFDGADYDVLTVISSSDPTRS
jgi:hypothetical protein